MTESILFAGGGTGGHVFPMIAVADAVTALAPAVRIVFVGTSRGIETKVVPERGYELEVVDARPIRGGGVAGALMGVVHAARSIPDARSFVRRLAPRAVFSIGGYAAGSVCVAARTLRIPLALMEPNSAIGLANRLVAPMVQRAYTAFPESEEHFSRSVVRRTGVPIRAGFSPRPFDPGPHFRILVLGGSQGAESLNDSVPRALALLEGAPTVVHQSGAGRDGAVRSLYAELGLASRATVEPFIDDMASALAAADFVIGRAGASAVAEMCAVGRPGLLIPYPFAGDHQRFNAESLARAGASVCVLQKDATVDRLATEISALIDDRASLGIMAEKARLLGRPDAAHVIAKDLLDLAGIDGSFRGGATNGSSAEGSPARQARSMARLGREPERNIHQYLSTGSAGQTKLAAGIGGRPDAKHERRGES
jgi:UDP-N-acetylglucosamine--N-acetylmuramyl-(pentapeptide) pyrophosphoryl-undecaprenol N-acetylglucosamine transferase